LRQIFQHRLDQLAAQATGSSNHIARVLILDEPPSLDAHEVTDKGSINQRAALKHRAHLVEELYSRPFSSHVLVAAASF
jgi:feruloyl-CoA synthase